MYVYPHPHTHTHTVYTCSLDKAVGKEVCGMFGAVCRQVGHCVLHHDFEHGCCRLKLIPRGVGLQHLYNRCTNTPGGVKCTKMGGCKLHCTVSTCIQMYTDYGKKSLNQIPPTNYIHKGLQLTWKQMHMYILGF